MENARDNLRGQDMRVETKHLVSAAYPLKDLGSKQAEDIPNKER